MKYVIAYDIGTTGIKTCLFKLDKKIELIADASNAYSLFTLPNGGAEQDPEDWWNEMAHTTKLIFKKCKVKPEQVEAISFCAQMQALVLVDKNCNPVRNAMSYMDQRSTEEVKKGIAYGLKIAGANIFKLIPSLIITGAVSSSVKDPLWKFKWVEAHEPNVLKKAYKWLDVKDFLTSRCTGEFTMTEDSAYCTFLYDNRKNKHCWSKKLCKMFNINMDLLPRVIKSTDAIGNGLTVKAAKHLGLKPGTKVFGGGGDSSLIGVGAGATRIGDTHIYCGTSGWVSTVLNKRKVDASSMIAAIASAEENKYNYFAEMETAGKCFEWVRDHLALDEIDIYLEKRTVDEGFESKFKTLFEYLNYTIKDVKPGSNCGLLFTPWLHGNRCPFEDPNACGMFFGLKLETGKTEMIHSVLAGIYYHLRWMLEKQDNKIKTSKVIRFVGGGAMSDIANQFLCNIIGREVEVVKNPQNVGAVGAAAVMGVGLGLIPNLDSVHKYIPIQAHYKPDMKRHAEHEPYYRVFKQLYKSNAKNFNNLHNLDAKDKDKAKAEKMRVLKFVLFSISAGVIQLVSNLILISALPKTLTFAPTLAYLISLVLSVIWNFTFNRKFTFKSATNVPKSMALAFLFYVFFAPASLFLEGFLANGDVLGFQLPMFLNLPGDGILGTIICMVFNFVLEFIWQRFVVFRDSIDSNKK